MSDSNYLKIEAKLNDIGDLKHISNILHWDEAVVMPQKSATSRNQALGALSKLIHQKNHDPELKQLIQKINQEELNCWQKANFQWIKKKQIEAYLIPENLVLEKTIKFKESEQAWRQYRHQNNWKGFLPYLERTVAIAKKIAQIKADYYQVSPYDALLDDFSPGVRSSEIDDIFSQLKVFLPKTIKVIVTKQKQDTFLPFEREFDLNKQKFLAHDLMKIVGFDFEYGRLDTSDHPFCGGNKDDVRITTRYSKTDLLSSAMAVCHETGHAMYELQLPKQYKYQPVGQALGMSVHESQSLLVEMHACRNKGFIAIMSSLLHKHFANDQNMDIFSSKNLYTYLTQVKPGLIRVGADEVTYPLHVILRYEIEKALINDEITVKDLPKLWDEKMLYYLGVDTHGNYQDGVMQDVHWPAGLFGYFPAYALGAVLAAQFYEAALKSDNTIDSAMNQGSFSPLMNWLKAHVHSQGSLHSFHDLVKQATGKDFSVDSYINHIKKRYLGSNALFDNTSDNSVVASTL